MANSLSFAFNLGVVAAQGKRSFTANGLPITFRSFSANVKSQAKH
jgi:hypothetical protein